MSLAKGRLVAAVALLLGLAATAQAAEPELSVGAPAPSFSLKTLNPERSKRRVVALKTFVGTGAPEAKKAVLLSFAASYCEPCKKELRDLKAEQAKLERSGVQTLIVVIDTDQEGVAKMQRLVVDELDLSIPVLSDRFAILARRYRAEKLPYVVLIDGRGVVRWVHAGYDFPALKAALAELKG